jgi:uncharacterized repeat protein (TIGR03803 family)
MKTVFAALFASVVGCACVQPVAAAEPAKYSEKVLYSFCSQPNCTDGAYPLAGLIAVKGTLYGTTVGGGITNCNGYGCGTVFSIDPSTGAENVLYSFCAEENCADGANPYAGLIDVKGTLYGTTFEGGAGFQSNEFGTAFALDLKTGAEKVLYSFCSRQNCPDGAYLVAGLIEAKNGLYGTTNGGGADDGGTAFALDPNTGAETVLYSFCSEQDCADGADPGEGLIDVKDVLYGTTAAGGAYSCGNDSDCGTMFSIDPNTGTETVLHSFGNGIDGSDPGASVIAVNGMLYGTTYGGGVTGCGSIGCGAVFSIDPNTGAEKVLYSFCSQKDCMDGANPTASLIDVKGTLYGTTYAGGSPGCGGGGCGTVFSIDPNTAAEKVIHSFGNGTDGQNPEGGLFAAEGTLYGTTFAGGSNGGGTVFALTKR